MADGIEVKINIPDFKAQLDAFGIDFQRKTVRAGVVAAAQAIKKSVIAAAPVLRSKRKDRAVGVLRRSIYIARSKQSTSGSEHYVVSFRKQKRSGGDPFYGRFLEEGWI